MREKIYYIPRFYSLSFDTEQVAVIFRIEKYTLLLIRELLGTKSHFMEYVLKFHPVKESFSNIGQSNLSFGFEDQFEFYEENEITFDYIWRIKPAKYYTGNICSKCKGSGESKSGSRCSDCIKGKEVKGTEDTSISSGLKTFYVLTEIFSFLILDYVCDKEYKLDYSNQKQLIHLEIAPIPKYAKAYVHGWTDNSIIDWIRETSDDSGKLIIEAMESVERKLWLQEPCQYSFDFIWDGENFGLKVPGNACDVGTFYGNSGNLYTIGKSLGCHNTDNSSQQMSFIAGFAKLYELVENPQV